MSAPAPTRRGPRKRTGTTGTTSGRTATRTRSTAPTRTRSSGPKKAAPRRAGRDTAPGGSRSAAVERAYRRRGRRASLRGSATAGLAVGRTSFVAVIMCMLVAGLSLTLFLTTRSAENAYRLGEIQDANRTLEHQAQSLRREVESARSAPVLARAATELGMVPANSVARLVVGDDNSVEVVGEPTPAVGPPQPTLVPANGVGEVRMRLTPTTGGSAVVRTPSGANADESLVARVDDGNTTGAATDQTATGQTATGQVATDQAGAGQAATTDGTGTTTGTGTTDSSTGEGPLSAADSAGQTAQTDQVAPAADNSAPAADNSAPAADNSVADNSTAVNNSTGAESALTAVGDGQ